jgi:hypothetical protein
MLFSSVIDFLNKFVIPTEAQRRAGLSLLKRTRIFFGTPRYIGSLEYATNL